VGRAGQLHSDPEKRILLHMLEELEARIAEARSGEHPISLHELEELYTTGCAQVLELEADAVRISRRVSELREQLRHVRTAIDWLQEEEADARERPGAAATQ
jgi:hypothetical protein